MPLTSLPHAADGKRVQTQEISYHNAGMLGELASCPPLIADWQLTIGKGIMAD